MKVFGLELVANVSILFREASLEAGPVLAKKAGFGFIESWWPFVGPAPGEREVREFVGAVETSGTRLVALNAFGGYPARGDRGLACRAERHGELLACLPTLLEVARATGCRMFNCPYGKYGDSEAPVDQARAAADVIAEMAATLGTVGGTLLLEPMFLGEGEEYPLRSVEDVTALIDGPLAERGSPPVGVLADFFHLGAYGADIVDVVRRYGKLFKHVQIADYPGRHQPGTGSLPLHDALVHLSHSGYKGYVSCEYVPSGEGDRHLSWARDFERLKFSLDPRASSSSGAHDYEGVDMT